MSLRQKVSRWVRTSGIKGGTHNRSLRLTHIKHETFKLNILFLLFRSELGTKTEISSKISIVKSVGFITFVRHVLVNLKIFQRDRDTSRSIVLHQNHNQTVP